MIALAVATLGCGGGEPASVPAATIAPVVTAPAPADPTAASTEIPTVTAIDEGATATEPAERLDDDIVMSWIGGSDLELEDRSLPRAVEALLPQLDGRSIVIDVDTAIAPLPSDAVDSVERAADRNVDALVVSLSPSWTAWDGHEECLGIVPAHDFYLCVLTPRPVTDVRDLEADLVSLVDAIVATGIPAYVYTIPHSTDSLANPPLEALLGEAETVFTRIAPSVDRVEYLPTIVTRGRDDLAEGTEFFDMVHPTAAGIDLLAPFFVDEFVQFLETRTSN